MASVIVTLRIMPSSPDVDLSALEIEASDLISGFGGRVDKSEVQPIAFGLKALVLHFIMDEKKGSTDKLESDISKIDCVNGVEVIDVRRAIG